MSTLVKSFQVRCYGDSLALPRPNYVKLEQTYFYQWTHFLREQRGESIHLLDRSKASATSLELNKVWFHDNVYFGNEIHRMVLHFGICDCAPRPIPPLIRRMIDRLPKSAKKYAIQAVHSNRPRLQKCGFVWQHVNPKVFRNIVEGWLDTAAKSTEHIFVLNIAPTNCETEMHSPGLSKSIQQYNAILAELIASRQEANIHLVDINKMINQRISCIDEYVLKEDGHHITPLTHTWIAQQLIEIEREIIESNGGKRF